MVRFVKEGNAAKTATQSTVRDSDGEVSGGRRDKRRPRRKKEKVEPGTHGWGMIGGESESMGVVAHECASSGTKPKTPMA